MEVVPGVHRIESDLGPRFVCQYALVGDERTLLVDSGLRDTPLEAIAPALERIGVGLEAVDYLLTSHADVDHCGGNRAFRERSPRARILCHELDRRWVERNAAMLAENYAWYGAYGFGPDRAALEWIEEQLGGDTPVDIGLRGGETIRLGPDWAVEVMHIPGHTPGHVGLWDPRSATAIAIDAVLERGVYDRAGNRLIPPRYYNAADYRATIRRLRALGPDVLLTAHYPVMEGGQALAFLDRSLAFTEELESAVRAGMRAGVSDLWELTQAADRAVGPYPEFMVELGASVRAHMMLP